MTVSEFNDRLRHSPGYCGLRDLLDQYYMERCKEESISGSKRELKQRFFIISWSSAVGKVGMITKTSVQYPNFLELVSNISKNHRLDPARILINNITELSADDYADFIKPKQ